MAKTETDQTAVDIAAVKLNDARPAYLEIDLKAFAANFAEVRKLAGNDLSIMAVVKANAYGHGAPAIARCAQNCGATFLGVAFIEEGEQLLNHGIKVPIVVLYPDLPERALRLVKSDLIATVDDIEYAIALNSAAALLKKKARVFLKLETGMGRYGLDPRDLRRFKESIEQLKNIKVIGITTNLANSAMTDGKLSKMQLAAFAESIDGLDDETSLNYKSIENSGGLLYSHQDRFNLIRIGILLYGVSPNGLLSDRFQPVMSLKSRIIKIKRWPAGRPLGYGGTFVPDRESLIATIPVGYADGLPWLLSNRGRVLIKGKSSAIVGKVCMDAIMVDVTEIPGVESGEEVVLIGQQGNERITIEEVASTAGSFPYEILTRMSERLPRYYKEST